MITQPTQRLAVGFLALLLLLCVAAPLFATPAAPANPVLVIRDAASSNKYQDFVPELVKFEGFNSFQVAELSEVDAAYLSQFPVVILPSLSVTSQQATLFQGYVTNGGTLIAFRPDGKLASIFGLTSTGGTLSEAWLQINTQTAVGRGLEAATLRFHTTADLYTVAPSTTVLATLYQTHATPTSYPAAGSATYGSGSAIFFSFDLAASIALMRQGNPAWAGYPNNHDGFKSMRSSQMFLDGTTSWNSVGDGSQAYHRNDIPQADIQARLFGNALITGLAKMPIPRFWYMPNQNKAMLLMTADNHSEVADQATSEIQTVRSNNGFLSLYIWHPFGTFPASTISGWSQAGHDIGVHPNDTAEMDASNVGGSKVTFAGMTSVVNSALASFATTYPSTPAPKTNRNHYLLWATTDENGQPDQTAQARILANAGIQMDVSYSSFPNTWGYMTGSGLPMKFVDPTTGAIIPVYEQATHYEDDIQAAGDSYGLGWTQSASETHYQASLADSASKYNTAVTMLFHPDLWGNYQAYASGVEQYAVSNNIPVWSVGQWLRFWSGRDQSAFTNVAFASNTLTFNVVTAAQGMTVMVPRAFSNSAILGITADGSTQSYSNVTLQGIDYGSFVIPSGTHSVAVAYSPTFALSGNVSPSAAASTASMSLSGGPDNLSTTTSAANGTYSFSGLKNGTYTVTPAAAGYTWAPTSRSVTITSAPASNVDFTASVVSVTQTLFTTQTPAQTSLTDGSTTNYELGMQFMSDAVGEITAIRFWKPTNDTGTHIGKLWTAGGQLLASVTFANETASGWQQQALSAPVRIAPNTAYVVSVNTGNSYYVATDSGLATQVVNQRLRSVVGTNGLYGNPGQFPTASYHNTNYFRDVVFSTNLTGAISGVLSPGTYGSGGSVSITGPTSASTTADANGQFSFGGLSSGAYAVTPTKPGVVFNPTSQSATVNGDTAVVTFTASPQPYKVSGAVTPASASAGATVTLTGSSQSVQAVVDASGNYSFNNVVNGTYTVTVSQPGYGANPLSQTVTVNAADVSGVNFTVVASPSGLFSISGSVTPASSATGTLIAISGPTSGSTVVDANGNFQFSGVPSGTYTITPTLQGYSFTPSSASATITNASVTGVTFTATGNATFQTLLTAQTPSVPSATDGVNYELGMRFVSDVAGQITAVRYWKPASDIGTHVGKIWNAAGQLLGSVTFVNESASGWQQQSLSTPLVINASTEYMVSVNTAATYYVSTDAGFTQSVKNLHLSSVVGSNGRYGTAGAYPTNSYNGSNYFRDVAFVNQTGTLPSNFTMSGTISPVASGAGATVTITGPVTRTVTADASGNYSLTSLPNGLYTVVVANGSYGFSPSSRQASISYSDTANVNFTGTSLAGKNATVIENSYPGSPNWQLKNGAYSHEIEGYTGAPSVDRGGSIAFYINSNGAAYSMQIYRMGWYQGLGARLVSDVGAQAGTTQSGCPIDPTYGIVECNWPATYTLTTGSNWASGAYVAKLTRNDTGKDTYLHFVVRDPASTSDILFQSNVNTMQAYNNWGGKSLYYFQSSGANPTQSVSAAAVKVSFNRPFNTFDPAKSADSSENYLRWEYLMTRWLESQGFDVSYATNLDIHLDAASITQHRLLLTAGHSEYWTSKMRDNIQVARDAGTSLAFFSANNIYWQVRYEPSSTGTPNRTIVGFKESATQFDPQIGDPASATTRFRDSAVNRPENRFLGSMYGEETNQYSGFAFTTTNSAHPFYRNTGVTNSTAIPSLIGNEWDNLTGTPTSNSPANVPDLTVVASSPTDSGSADSVVYQAKSNALVFSVSSIQWSFGLDNATAPLNAVDSRAQQITANVLMDMGALPQTPATSLVVSAASSISGTVTPAVAGITVTLTGAANRTVVTDASGNFIVKDVVPGTYVVAPSFAGYSFSPASQNVTVSASSVSGVNFTASNQTYSINGSVSPLPTGTTTIQWNGASSGSTTPAANGTFTVPGLPNGTYTFTPVNANYLFSPNAQTITISGASITLPVFSAYQIGTGSFTISGTITPAANASGATVSLSGTTTATATVDASGNFTFPNIPTGSYTATPSKSGFAFTPVSQQLSVLGANVTGVNFTIGAPAQPVSLFTSQVPAQVNLNDGTPYELGTRFMATASGKITAIRFYKGSSETGGTHTGKIWSATGQLLASVAFTGETASGWQQQALPTSLHIDPNIEYMVSVNTVAQRYVATTSGLASQITNGNLVSIVGTNGRYGALGSYPTSSYSNSNYFRDVVFLKD